MTDQVRITGVIRNGMYNQIKELQKTDPGLAGELAISYFEQILTGKIESKNPVIQAIISGFEPIVKNDQKKYDKKVEAQQEKRIEKLQLRELAKFLAAGDMTYEQIGKRLGVQKSAVSKRIKVLKEEFPFLMEEANEDGNLLESEALQTWETLDENGRKHFKF